MWLKTCYQPKVAAQLLICVVQDTRNEEKTPTALFLGCYFFQRKIIRSSSVGMKNTENQQLPTSLATLREYAESFSVQISSCPFVLDYKIPNINYITINSWQGCMKRIPGHLEKGSYTKQRKYF